VRETCQRDAERAKRWAPDLVAGGSRKAIRNFEVVRLRVCSGRYLADDQVGQQPTACPEDCARSAARISMIKNMGRHAGDVAARNADLASGSIGSPLNAESCKTQGGRRSRNKGSRTERALVRFLQERGFAAEKISGMYKSGPDLSVPLLGIDRRVEVKCRGNGFRQVYAWLAGVDLLILRADRCEPVVVVPLRLAAEIASAAERGRR